MNTRKIISIMLVILWMSTVFCFSHQQGTGSSGTSKTVSRIIIKILDIKNETTEKQQEEIVEVIEPIIRKLAHYTIYIIGGILIMNCVYLYTQEIQKASLYGASIGVMYAISDEIHQLFIIGRSGKILDVVIDSLGIFTGIVIYLIINKVIESIIDRKKIKGGE